MTVRPGVTTTSADAVTERCMSGFLETNFLHVSGKEADLDRIGYLYSGFQALGTYNQWPATDSCNWGSYDPRLRPWYVGAASGPKDVVIVIDTSGSMMTGGRKDVAKSAAKTLVDTLTDSDFVAVVKFSGSAEIANAAGSGGSHLVRATHDNRAALDAWIESNIDAGGTTNFGAALGAALTALENTPSSSGCTKTILFLSDGDPTSGTWTEAIQTDVNDRAAALGAHIFTYALGSGVNPAYLKDIACTNRGAIWQASESSDLPAAMTDYYTFLAPLNPPCQVRWREYNDSITGTPLLAACLPMYKKEGATYSDSCSGGATGCVPELIGVTCMDVSLIVEKAVLDARADASAFYALVDADQAACSNVVPNEAQLQAMRARILPKFGDAVCSVAGAAARVVLQPNPPAAPAPPPPKATITMVVAAAGDVADYTTAVLNAIEAKIAAEAGVPVDRRDRHRRIRQRYPHHRGGDLGRGRHYREPQPAHRHRGCGKHLPIHHADGGHG